MSFFYQSHTFQVRKLYGQHSLRLKQFNPFMGHFSIWWSVYFPRPYNGVTSVINWLISVQVLCTMQMDRPSFSSERESRVCSKAGYGAEAQRWRQWHISCHAASLGSVVILLAISASTSRKMTVSMFCPSM